MIFKIRFFPLLEKNSGIIKFVLFSYSSQIGVLSRKTSIYSTPLKKPKDFRILQITEISGSSIFCSSKIDNMAINMNLKNVFDIFVIDFFIKILYLTICRIFLIMSCFRQFFIPTMIKKYFYFNILSNCPPRRFFISWHPPC